jgi:hypothetical protein
MWSAFPTSEYYGGSAPSRSRQPTVSLSAAPLDARPDGRDQDGSHVHHVPINGGSAQLFPDSLAMGTPQSFPMASTRDVHGRQGVASPSRGSARTAARPISTGLEPVPHLRGFSHWFTFVTHSRLACRTRAVRSFRRVPSLSGLLATFPGTSRVRLPSASPDCCDSSAAAVLHHHSDHMAPHGAP